MEAAESRSRRAEITILYDEIQSDFVASEPEESDQQCEEERQKWRSRPPSRDIISACLQFSPQYRDIKDGSNPWFIGGPLEFVVESDDGDSDSVEGLYVMDSQEFQDSHDGQNAINSEDAASEEEEDGRTAEDSEGEDDEFQDALDEMEEDD
mmetsp:Transcript_25096/g.39400  ORF Transcript_25096/g.39400 Transcript_25096/m.39400 type:complete len:152 (+) Transcript_25096:201-656(+)